METHLTRLLFFPHYFKICSKCADLDGDTAVVKHGGGGVMMWVPFCLPLEPISYLGWFLIEPCKNK